jgi:hypothetical protein
MILSVYFRKEELMADVIDFMECRDRRTAAANEAFIDGVRSLDPSDPEYTAKARGLSEIHKQLVADDANREVEYHNRVLEEQEEKEFKTSRWVEIAKVVGGVLAGIGAVAGAVSNVWIFSKVTDYEKNVDEGAPGAFRTMGDREVAQEAMRHGFFKRK